MERVGEWRMIEAEDPEQAAAAGAATGDAKKALNPRLIVGAVIALVLGVAGVAIWVTVPQGGVKIDLAEQGGNVTPLVSAAPAAAAVTLVVDVEGAVVDPGVHSVLAGGRVADAIAAAGGYSAEVDIAATAAALNLAALVTDGQKVHVPARGEIATLPGGATPAPVGGATGPIDVNHASAEELDTLPGIGPVTAAKIIAARPFATIDELDSRDVVGPSTLEKIRDLVTITP